MGNQLVGIAPSQIFPVEHYLSELTDLQFDVNLGSTRFLKVARAKYQEGLVVVKVFAIHDPTLPLQAYKTTVDVIRNKLADTVNCLAFQKAVLSDKAGYLMREYVKYSLYDRISTRPFLLPIEKKWIAFQILYALHQCHKVGVCHGDIKLENLLITSWHWVLLSDFASYKPTYLPDDNPADFSYFFDTSRRRTCYLAPERFVRAPAGPQSGLDSQMMFSDEGTMGKGELTPAMDIFSAGCVLAELFSDGCLAPFDFSQLLAYRIDEYSPFPILDKLEEPRVRDLIVGMIQKVPSKRESAENSLSNERGKLFPEYFYTFLQSYMLIFSKHDPILSPDEKIERLKKDIHNIIAIVTAKPDLHTGSPEQSLNTTADAAERSSPNHNSDGNRVSESESDARRVDDNVECAEDINIEENTNWNERKHSESSEGRSEHTKSIGNKVAFTPSTPCKEDPLILITSLVTSCIRGLHFPSSKQSALSILVDISRVSSSETILDRTLPYVVYLVEEKSKNNNTCRVRADAIHALTACLQCVTEVPVNNTHVFPEYIIPCLSRTVTDNSVIVRTALAQNIATLVETGLRFLEYSTGVTPKHSYESELASLHEMIQGIVSVLLTDSQSIVKQTLIENDAITKLCIFFGKQKTNDYLLSHMITFLNDKHNPQLRASFFDNIVGVAAYIGIHSSSMITPLLLQGFVDEEEFIVRKALNALTALTQLNLLEKYCLYEILNETCCLLIHPNLWIRHSMVSFLSSLSTCKHLNPVDIQCKILPLIKPYVKYSIIQLDKIVILLNALKPPLPRHIYSMVVKYVSCDLFLYTLVQRYKAKGGPDTEAVLSQAWSLINQQNVEDGLITGAGNRTSIIANVFRKLASEGMTEDHEEYILLLARHLRKLVKNTSTTKPPTQDSRQESGSMHMGDIQLTGIQSHSVVLTDTAQSYLKKTDSDANMNEEWRHMFTSRPLVKPNNPMLYSDTSNSELSISDAGDTNINSVQERSYIQYHYAPCKLELRKLIQRHQELHSAHAKGRTDSTQAVSGNVGGVIDPSSATSSSLPPSKWRLRSILVAHLHEHRGGVTRIENIPTTSLVASASWDSTVKLWDLAKLEGKNIANRSKCSINTQSQLQGGVGVINAMTVCDSNRSLAVCNAIASDKGVISVVRIDSSKMNIVSSRTLNECPSDVQRFDNNVIAYSCITGQIAGWDLRVSNTSGNAWKLDNDLKKGAIFALHVDSRQYQLVVGTSLGSFTCWDLRFKLPVSTFSHPHNLRVRRIIAHPSSPSCIIASTTGNNEVSVWNLESGVRLSTFWSAPSPPLSAALPGHSVCGLYASEMHGKRNGFLLACGTDQRVRYWGLDNPNESYLAIPSGFEYNNPPTLTYEYNLIDGIKTAQEISIRSETPRTPVPPTRSSTAGVEDSPRAGPEQVVPGHFDVVTDLTLGQASQCLLVTGSNDGVVKVWK
uniref:non-specific serine/threonine protein kinase n=1 Tax=Cacopsylla melanoneura TaxID=428564 RepID=A0A8D8VIJ6_9HEMI